MAKLTLDDIADLRAYERERDEFRREVIALKKRRRVPLGDFVTLLFENSRTIRFQIQEMARVEKIITDEGIANELRVYNPLIPDPGQLCATLFIELTSKLALMEWLPKLVGIERSVSLRLPDGELVPAVVDEDHEKQLTREEVTASVHYVRWELDHQTERFEAALGGPADYPNWPRRRSAADPRRAESDLRTGPVLPGGPANLPQPGGCDDRPSSGGGPAPIAPQRAGLRAASPGAETPVAARQPPDDVVHRAHAETSSQGAFPPP